MTASLYFVALHGNTLVDVPVKKKLLPDTVCSDPIRKAIGKSSSRTKETELQE